MDISFVYIYIYQIYQVARVNAVLFEKQKFQIEVLSGISLVFSV